MCSCCRKRGRWGVEEEFWEVEGEGGERKDEEWDEGDVFDGGVEEFE